MEEQAPNIGRNYPSAGAIIGPAWNTTWRALSDGSWNTIDELMSISDIGVNRKTIQNLLGKAYAKGMIERRYRKIGSSRMKVQYRRKLIRPAGE